MSFTEKNYRPKYTNFLIAIAGLVATGGLAFTSNSSSDGSSSWDSIARCETWGAWNINTLDSSLGEQMRIAKNVLKSQGFDAWPVCGPLEPRATSTWNGSPTEHGAHP